MNVLETSKLLDEELYSRQLYVLGLPAMQRIQGAKVLLSGLQGLGAEIAKNLVLMGVGILTLHDPHPTCWSDLAAQFFLSEQDLGRSRAEASQELLAKLNGAVQVCIHTGDITEDLLLDFQVVVLTASKLEEQLKVGTFCHKHGVCFLVADTRGLVGQLFCDFGEDFTVEDPTEAEPLRATIQHISQVDAEMVVGLAQALEPLKGTEGESSEEQLDEALVRTVALSSAGSLSPIATMLGAVAAQEVLKAVSKKFMPLDQWLYFDALDCLPEDEEPFLNPEDYAPRDCRYDGQIAVFGAGFQKKLSHQHYLLVGAGAIGCELLKGFALVGLGAGGSGGVTVADMDHVERSNLSRQFLFRPQDIGRPKAEVAAEAAHHLNSNLKVTPLTYPLDPTTEHIYGDNFFSNVDGVAAALDSFQARHYVAARCTHYLKPLLEAGTNGTRGSACVFMPDVTDVYRGPASDADSEDASYPVCTVRYFPSTAKHTLQWARDEFEGLFHLSAETIKRYQQEGHPQGALISLADMDGPQVLTLLQVVLGVLRERPQTWRDCVLWALGHWQLCFHYGIIQLLRLFPPDKVLEDGTPFWSSPRQCPQPLEFDASQDMHLLYVLAAANLYAQMHGLPGSRDQTELRGLLKLLPLPELQDLAPIFASDLELAWASAELGPEHLKKLHEALEIWSTGPPLEPLMFEKDNDNNFHVDFVTAAASLRAQNYGIPPANRTKSKRIVGRIIPAVATTTAAVAGLVGLELYKVVGGPRPLSAFRHNYLHLAENYFSRWVPFAPAIQKFQHLEWTCWKRLEVPAGEPERTLESLLAHLQELLGVRVTMLMRGPAVLYSAGWSLEKQAWHLPLRVTEVMRQVTGQAPEPGQRVLVLELSCEGDEEDTTFPPVHYKL
ncbi:ubiquitin-like modifier-activating enzyme 7 isoform X6 [Camelus ferus]|uniref:Ubiquitin-like modifier-activating enzyme 7 isoform X6 n=1 Tax=Camelus ferus TaxID=419612 RepID=A0A8B7KDB4_CAMFR|nr:ubiquitin-like modifier-activating enzyme 7 isoform X6 [Camelus ferus]